MISAKRSAAVLVAASTDCYRELPMSEALSRLCDLEFTSVEIVIDENGVQLKPSQVAVDIEEAAVICRDTHRLDIIAYDINITAQGEDYYRHFQAACRLAKATKVVTLTVPSCELGTPFNEEVERLRKLVAIAATDGIRVGIKSQVGRLSQDPDTVVVLCDNVKGLGLTLDPSHYICGPHAGR